MSDDLLTRARRLSKAAHPAPWKANVWWGTEEGGWCAVGPHHELSGDADGCYDQDNPGSEPHQRAAADAAFIAASRELVPALVAECERLRSNLNGAWSEADLQFKRADLLCSQLTEARDLIARAESAERERDAERGTTTELLARAESLERQLVACQAERDEARGSREWANDVRLAAQFAKERDEWRQAHEDALSSWNVDRVNLAARIAGLESINTELTRMLHSAEVDYKSADTERTESKHQVWQLDGERACWKEHAAKAESECERLKAELAEAKWNEALESDVAIRDMIEKNVADAAEAIAAWLDGKADYYAQNRNIGPYSAELAADIRSGAWRPR